MTEEMDGQMSLFDPDSWSGKTSPVRSAAIKARTSESSSKRRQGLRTVVPLFLDLRKENGLLREPSWEMGGPLLGEYSTPSFGESPRDAVESHLSQILEGGCAPEILFERKGLSGDIAESGEQGQETATDAQNGIDCTISFQERAGKPGRVKESSYSAIESAHSQPLTTNVCYPINTMIGTRGNKLGERTGLGIDDEGKPGYTISAAHSHAVCYKTVCLNDQGGSQMGVTNDVSGTLRAQEHGHQPCIVFEPGAASRCGGHVYENGVAGTLRAEAGDNKQAVVYGISSYESNAMKSSNPHSGIYEAETARTLDNNGGSPACNQGGMAIVQCYDARGNGDGDTAPTMTGDHQSRITDYTAIITGPDTVSTLQARDYKGVGRMDTVSRLTYSLQGSMIGRADKNGPQGDGINEGKCFTLNSTDRHAVANAIVRRLTPLECERLQGFPNGWTHIGDWIDSKGKKHRDADSPKYKALGNSIALPPWAYVLSRLNGYCVEHTMASLFDGIGGFPLIWERLNGKGSAVWASEVEEFPIAVTKTRFGQE